MKKITKSMVAAGAAAMLALGMCAAMTGCTSSPYSLYSQNTSHVSSTGKYIKATDFTDDDSISNLTINWSNGKVIIESTTDEWMSYKVSGDSSTSSDTCTCYYINNTSMWIEEQDPNLTSAAAEKTLTVYLPTWDYLEYLEINGQNVTVENNATSVRNMLVDIDSGDVTTMGSALMTMYDITTDKGNITLTMPSGYDATISAKSSSGKVTCSLGTKNSSGDYVNGSGKYQQSLTASGDITVKDQTMTSSDYTWEHWINSERYAE